MNIWGPQEKSGERDRVHCKSVARSFGRGGLTLQMLARLALADLRNKLPVWLSWPKVTSIRHPVPGGRRMGHLRYQGTAEDTHEHLGTSKEIRRA